MVERALQLDTTNKEVWCNETADSRRAIIHCMYPAVAVFMPLADASA